MRRESDKLKQDINQPSANPNLNETPQPNIVPNLKNQNDNIKNPGRDSEFEKRENVSTMKDESFGDWNKNLGKNAVGSQATGNTGNTTGDLMSKTASGTTSSSRWGDSNNIGQKESDKTTFSQESMDKTADGLNNQQSMDWNKTASSTLNAGKQDWDKSEDKIGDNKNFNKNMENDKMMGKQGYDNIQENKTQQQTSREWTKTAAGGNKDDVPFYNKNIENDKMMGKQGYDKQGSDNLQAQQGYDSSQLGKTQGKTEQDLKYSVGGKQWESVDQDKKLAKDKDGDWRNLSKNDRTHREEGIWRDAERDNDKKHFENDKLKNIKYDDFNKDVKKDDMGKKTDRSDDVNKKF